MQDCALVERQLLDKPALPPPRAFTSFVLSRSHHSRSDLNNQVECLEMLVLER